MRLSNLHVIFKYLVSLALTTWKSAEPTHIFLRIMHVCFFEVIKIFATPCFWHSNDRPLDIFEYVQGSKLPYKSQTSTCPFFVIIRNTCLSDFFLLSYGLLLILGLSHDVTRPYLICLNARLHKSFSATQA